MVPKGAGLSENDIAVHKVNTAVNSILKITQNLNERLVRICPHPLTLFSHIHQCVRRNNLTRAATKFKYLMRRVNRKCQLKLFWQITSAHGEPEG